ncbi:unnamed protein product [Ectocarpus sp. 6 AP-2014]
MEAPAASTTAPAAAAPAGAAAAAGAPGVRRATTTGTIPATPSHQVSFEDDNATARPGAREIRKGRSEPYGREIAVLREQTKKKLGEEKPVFMNDIRLGPKDESFEHIQVHEARSRVRVGRLKYGRNVKADEKGDDDKLNLTFRMMLGVRVAVGRQASPFSSEGLTADDYTQQDKYVFPPAGAGGRLPTPSHKLNRTFKFRDYAPKVFKNLRGLFGIDEASYMNSVAGDYDYLELITNSKSGSFFFYSHDQKYIIKNMKRAEAKFFRSILPQYYEHHRTHPDSVLIRFCGMYLVKKGHKKIPFIVMKCIDGTAQMKIHNKYDLKGSKVHRTAKEGEKVLKDNNLREAKTKFRLGSQRDAFLKVVRSDAEFLRDVNVMDYSMFVSVHDASRPPERTLQRGYTEFTRRPERTVRRGYTEFFTFADEASDGPKSAVKPIPSRRGEAFRAAAADTDGDGASTVGTETAKPSAGYTGAMRFRPDGGIDSEGDQDPKEIYWLGVIDVLQVYTNMKHAETWYKAIGRVKNELSCVDPALYCERFISFMEETTS